MPGIDKECEGDGATHSFACKCREEYFSKINSKLDEAVGVLTLIARGKKETPYSAMHRIRAAKEFLKKIRTET